MQNLSCDRCNHLVKPVRIHNYSETHLPFVAAKQWSWVVVGIIVFASLRSLMVD